MVPQGPETAALEAFRARGFTGSFVAAAGTLRLLGGSREFSPDEVTIRDYRRFEGVSDPDDMSIVYAIETADGTRGTLVDAFGVYASPAVAAVMARARIQRTPAPAEGPRALHRGA
jgi:hypothetical protein